MRRFLLGFIITALAWTLLTRGMAYAQPALDSTCVSNACLNNTTSGTTVTVSASSSSTNDVVYVGAAGGTNVAGGTPITWTVSGCTLTWTRRSRQAGLGSDNHTITLETWSAPAASALSSCTITATADRTIDAATIGYIAVHGLHSTAAPFDTNIAIPQPNQNLTGSTTTIAGTITTTEANDLIVGFSTGEDASCNTFPGGPPGGKGSSVGGIHNFGALVWSCMGIQIWGVTATQSATAWNTSQSHDNWYFLIDALTGDAPPATGRSRLIQ